MEEMQTIMQAAINAARAVVKTITEVTDLAEGSAIRNAAGYVGPKAGRPHLKQPTFTWVSKS